MIDEPVGFGQFDGEKVRVHRAGKARFRASHNLALVSSVGNRAARASPSFKSCAGRLPCRPLASVHSLAPQVAGEDFFKILLEDLRGLCISVVGAIRPRHGSLLPVPPQSTAEKIWFLTELQPHEPMLRAWLRSQFPSQTDVDDIVQEVFVRVLQAHAENPVRAPKAFLFVTARNLALMQLRRAKVVREESLTENEFLSILDESIDVPQAVARAQELELLTTAIQSLPTRCRQIVTLRKLYGMSQKDVAAELGIAEHTVEVQSGIALRKLGEFFARYTGQPRQP